MSSRIRQGFVIAVSGTSGAGKSTVMDHVARLLPDSVRLHFDDYVSLGNDPAFIRGWLDSGADVDAVETPALPKDLSRLRSGQAVELPGSRGVVEPAPFILLEEPFGRARKEIAPLVGVGVHIESPTDVALARRVLRRIDERGERDPLEVLGELRHDVHSFVLAGREAYQVVDRAARAAADVVLDGMKPPAELADELVAEVRRRNA